MTENIDLTKILKDCPKGTKFYSPVWGEVTFDRILDKELYTIKIDTGHSYCRLTKEGYSIKSDYAECILFPSKDQRDWNKFVAPWHKKEKFDPKTLVPFTKVLIWKDLIWMPTIFTFLDFSLEYPRMRYNTIAVKVIPYNNDTKHLVGKTDKAPEYYRYW